MPTLLDLPETIIARISLLGVWKELRCINWAIRTVCESTRQDVLRDSLRNAALFAGDASSRLRFDSLLAAASAAGDHYLMSLALIGLLAGGHKELAVQIMDSPGTRACARGWRAENGLPRRSQSKY